MFSLQEAENEESTDGDDSCTDHHYPKDKKTCFMCYEHFSTHHEFTAHQVNCKNKKQCPKCPLTGEAFKLVKNFECHTEMCNGEGSFKCPHCDRVFPQYDVARNHKYRCTGKKTCHVCNFMAKDSKAMAKHVEKHHRQFTCKQCNYHCLDRRTLTCHIQGTHNKK